VINVTDFFEI